MEPGQRQATPLSRYGTVTLADETLGASSHLTDNSWNKDSHLSHVGYMSFADEKERERYKGQGGYFARIGSHHLCPVRSLRIHRCCRKEELLVV